MPPVLPPFLSRFPTTRSERPPRAIGVCAALLVLVALLSAPPALRAQCTEAWDGAPGVPGANGPVFALEVYNDGSGPALFAGGAFSMIGGVAAPGLAKWDGTAWTAVGAGTIDFGPVRALRVFDDGAGPRLFVGGQFFGTTGIFISLVAAYDGTTWDTLLGGMEGTIVSALEVFDPGTGPRLYAGGTFETAGGEFAPGLASWNGTAWSGLGNAGIDQDVYALTTHDDGSGTALFVGGLFSSAGPVGALNVAKWNGTTWSSLAGGVNASVWTLASFGGSLIVGGDFTLASGNPAARIAAWDGIGYIDIGGADLNPWAMRIANISGTDRLIVAGAFTMIGGAAIDRIAVYDGAGFTPLAGGGADSDVRALAVRSGAGTPSQGLYAGGLFANVGTAIAAAGVARYENCAPPPSGVLFRRGDINSDGLENIADAIAALNLLFSPGVSILCDESADVNDDGTVNIADAISLLGFLFVPSTPPPPFPFGVCGEDTDGDAVDCVDPSPVC